MGLRERVTITLVIITLIQIACRHCMPRTPSKASLKCYLNNVKPVKNNPVPTPHSPSRVNKTPKHTFGKTAQNGRISQISPPKKSLYQTYKFPENEYPLDNSPRDPFRAGMTFNDNNHVYTLQNARNLQSSRINDLKKEMKMKRKLVSNKQANNENCLLKKDMSSMKFASNHDSMRLLESVTFPEIQYPLSTMETWGPNYWNQLPFNEAKQLNGFREQAFNLKAKEDMNNPFTRLTKAKASKYLQTYDKLKEEHKRTSTENSKRSNAGQKGLNFTKTATCERVSDDYITASLASNSVGKSTDMKRTLEPATKLIPSLENTYPVTKDSYYATPIPYKVIEDNIQNVCPTFELNNNTKELQNLDTNDIVQTLHLIEELLLYDGTSSAVQTGNFSNEIENNVNLSDSTDGLPSEDTPTTLVDCAKNCNEPSTEELPQKVSDSAPADILQEIMSSLPEKILTENTTIVSGPLNVRMPFPYNELITNETHPNLTSPSHTNMAPLSKNNAVPGTNSIIIIPINNNNFDGKSLSHLLEQIMSSSLDNSVPNNRLHNVLSNIAPLRNDNPSSTVLVSELLNSTSDSGSSLPIYETLPTNSMCNNNESSPSAMKEKLISDILIHKSLTDDAPFVVTSRDEKLVHQPTETGNFDLNTGTRSLTPDFKHPLFDFTEGEFTLPNQGPYNNVLDNDLPIITREISSDQQISNGSSENLFTSTQNVKPDNLNKNMSKDFFQPSEIVNDALKVEIDKSISSEIPTDSISQLINESLPIHFIKTTAEQPLSTETLLTTTPLSVETPSDKLPEITDWTVHSTPVTTKNSTPQLFDITPSVSTNVNHTLVMTDASLKTELYKIRQILDKMLSSDIPTDSQTVPIDTILSNTSDIERLPLLNKSLEHTQTPADIVFRPVVDKKIVPATNSQQEHDKLSHVLLDGTSSDILLLPVNESHIPTSHLLLDTVDSPPPIDEIDPPTLVLENPADNKPYLLDNLVTPVSKICTKDTLNNDLSPTVDLPLKMDLTIPNINEIATDDLPLSVVDLPIMVHQKPTTTLLSGDSINEFETQEFGPRNLSFDNSVSDLLHPTNVSPVLEKLGSVSSEVSAESHSKTMSGFTGKVQQNFTPTIVHSSVDVKQPQVNLLLSKQNITDVFDMEPVLPNDAQQSVNDKIEVPHTSTDTIDLSLHSDCLLATEDTTKQDTLVTNTPEAVTMSLINGHSSTDLDETSDELFAKPTLSDITLDNLSLPEDKLVPHTNNSPTDMQLPNKKTLSTSKLPIAKALLENVLSDITKGGLSSPLKASNLSVTPSSLMDKTLYHIDVEPRLSKVKEVPPVNTILPLIETSGNLANPKTTEDILPVDKIQSHTSFVDIPADFPIKIVETFNDARVILSHGVGTQENTKTLSLDNSTIDVLLPTDKVYPPNDDTLNRTSFSKQKICSSKLSITKAILENVLSDVTSRDFTLPVSKSVPIKLPSMLDNTLYYMKSPISANENSPSWPVKNVSNIEHSDNLIDNNLPYSGQNDPLQLKLELIKNSSDVSSLDIPTVSSVTDKKPPVSNDDVLSAKPEIIPIDTPSDLPLASGKKLASSKLPITKALLENVLSNIETKGFSFPEAKTLPRESRSQLDKTIYFMESPHSNLNEESSFADIQNVNVPSSETKDDDFELSLEKIFLDNPKLDIPTDELPNDQVYINDSNETSADYTTDDIDDFQTQVDKKLSVTDNKSYNFPVSQTIPTFASRIPITKALLEKVLSEIIDGGIRP